ncbi:hypothetical protein [Paraburkholderia bryophila]|uniref:Uncharacterized protein n=1 Tax=Paraburkholderia bryophila TaxID=420952 RepID=A0A329CWK9_9BURK|nr:hypothetical protein [Paraburkholderia bryophila]RAS38798.1 hypothetical protein BX591_101127 [Paraburkholderia bryophila]
MLVDGLGGHIVNAVESVVQTVLYDGFLPNASRLASTNNLRRWPSGGVYPRAYAEVSGNDPWVTQSECLLRGNAQTRVAVRPGFLQITGRLALAAQHEAELAALRPGAGEPVWRAVPGLDVDGRRYTSRQEALERHIAVPVQRLADLLTAPRETAFSFAASGELEPLVDRQGTVHGALRRTRAALQGRVELSASSVAGGVYRLRARIVNETPLCRVRSMSHDAASLHALVSCHTVLTIEHGAWISSRYPPDELAACSAACRNIGVWPVLIGDEQRCDTMLAAPVVLDDFPRIEPDRTGASFDARPPLASVRVAGGEVHVGDQVRLRPRGRADIFDIALSGMIATVESIERDIDEHVHVAVRFDDDPGHDAGMPHLPAQRFFFGADEIEPLEAAQGGGKRAHTLSVIRHVEARVQGVGSRPGAWRERRVNPS